MIFVNKKWGWERWVANHDLYCLKEMFLARDQWCSWHFHVLKDETFYVTEGRMLLEVRELIPGDICARILDPLHDRNWAPIAKHVVLGPGDSYRIKPLWRHRFSGLTDVSFFEVSTTHYEEDSYRVSTAFLPPIDDYR